MIIKIIKCDRNIGEAVEQEEKSYDDMKAVRNFTYQGDRVNANGGCQAAMI